MIEKKSVLFVCLGNICRSPAAEGVFSAYWQQQNGAAEIRIDSAGTIGFHAGKQADPRMRSAAEERGYHLHSRSRPLVPADLTDFDLIVAMDRENLADIQRLKSETKDGLAKGSGTVTCAEIKLFSDFLDDQWPSDVPDPYYGGAAGFAYVLDMLEAGCPRLASHLGLVRASGR